MKIVVAIDSFKGCLTSTEANEAAAKGIHQVMPDAEVMQIAVSDGGEGWLEAFRAAEGITNPLQQVANPLQLVTIKVYDPLMRPIMAQYLMKGDTAVIEIAKASGLTLLAPEERNPIVASTYGTGQLVADAVRRGCRHIIVGLGGSATSDCGIGMLRAIIDSFAHQRGEAGVYKEGHWDNVKELRDVRFTIATDVTNPLCGENGAAYVFAPQKVLRRGIAAMPQFTEQSSLSEMVRWLDGRAKRFAEASAKHFGYDRQDWPGAGAAGGLGYAFLQYMNAERRSGIDLLLETIRFDEMLRGGDCKSPPTLVITGEGTSDRQTLMGKLPFGILQRAKAHDVPVALMAGRVTDRELLLRAGFSHVVCINPPGLALEEALKPETAKRNIGLTASSLIKMIYNSIKRYD